jgi:hypothetical protein
MIHDFTHLMYEELLLFLKKKGYSFYRFVDYARKSPLNNPHAILRHDVDRFPKRALKLARLENRLHVTSSYFFRIKKTSFNAEIIEKISEMGHEIGYHYEELSDAKGDIRLAWRLFQENKKRFDQFGGITSIAMHGRPFSKWNNQELWKHCNYDDVGVLLDAFQDIDWQDYLYFTDTGRSWNSPENRRDRVPSGHYQKTSRIHTTNDLMSFLEACREKTVISTHPERWSDSSFSWILSLMQDTLINQIKRLKRVVS